MAAELAAQSEELDADVRGLLVIPAADSRIAPETGALHVSWDRWSRARTPLACANVANLAP